MWTRRAFLGSSLALPLVKRAHAQDQHEDLIGAAFALANREPESLGARPLPEGHELWKTAARYLNEAPRGGRPLDVARYLSTLPEEMIAEWPSSYANPLIMLQFAATRTEPSGDVTPWCAAFLSWCIERAGLQSQRSASSQAYLDWGSEAWNVRGGPSFVKEGDVAVFTRRSDSRRGHVGFFIGWAGEPGVRLLGGNQGNRIGEAVYRANTDLRLVTIRWA